jgi:hypothetical protein
MSQHSRFFVTLPMPILASVEAAPNKHVRVTWSAGKRRHRTELVDIAPLIGAFKTYKSLQDDESLFSTVHLTEDGNAVAWGANDEIDMSATSIERLAEDMMTADDLREFLKEYQLTHAAAAAVLGRSRRQIENYLAGEPIPRVFALACFGYRAQQQQLVSPSGVIQTQFPDSNNHPMVPVGGTTAPTAFSSKAVPLTSTQAGALAKAAGSRS